MEKWADETFITSFAVLLLKFFFLKLTTLIHLTKGLFIASREDQNLNQEVYPL